MELAKDIVNTFPVLKGLDGEGFINFIDIDTTTIALYIDYVELDIYRLVSHTGVHKLGFVYFTIIDLPVSLKSSSESIFLANVHYSLDVEKYECKAIFEPLIQDIKHFLDQEDDQDDNSLLHHKAGHYAYVKDVIDENITTIMSGVKSDCPISELCYWYVSNSLVVDVMLDLLEDWCATESYLI
ncbi:hypothetical protein NPIL_90381 [Nephila pilipes]|uniref:Uncharacterized protein n=1 Tax=Nephila pilipes TaxID=299642 RepID=A0A8X6TC84_NEPPI|nr:hypothetical protein NPIL_90381 [Nephila pilipes]